jgi:cytochrome P450
MSLTVPCHACRKAVATAFSTANMRAQFPNIRTACAQLVDVLKTIPANDVVDMDSALCRESLDVIGARPSISGD